MKKPFPQALLVRCARPDEIISILRVQIDALQFLCAKDYPPEQIEALANRNILHMSLGGDRRETLFVGDLDHAIVGVSGLLGSRISAVYVHPLYARQGIGTQLLQAIERTAIARHIKSLSVTASLTAQPFYQARGYRIVGESCIKAQSGMHIRCIEMQKQLQPDWGSDLNNRDNSVNHCE